MLYMQQFHGLKYALECFFLTYLKNVKKLNSNFQLDFCYKNWSSVPLHTKANEEMKNPKSQVCLHPPGKQFETFVRIT